MQPEIAHDHLNKQYADRNHYNLSQTNSAEQIHTEIVEDRDTDNRLANVVCESCPSDRLQVDEDFSP